MARKTYTGTLFYPDNLEDATVTLYISKVNKYDRGSRIYLSDKDPQDEVRREFDGMKSWSIIEGGPEAEALETIVDKIDDNHEYLVINFADGKSEVYPNSYVTMFIR